MHAISSYRDNRPTQTDTRRQDRLQYTAPQLARTVKIAAWAALENDNPDISLYLALLIVFVFVYTAFVSRVRASERDMVLLILSVCLFVCLSVCTSVCPMPALYQNEYTWSHFARR